MCIGFAELAAAVSNAGVDRITADLLGLERMCQMISIDRERA
jgi:hypothetical protein